MVGVCRNPGEEVTEASLRINLWKKSHRNQWLLIGKVLRERGILCSWIVQRKAELRNLLKVVTELNEVGMAGANSSVNYPVPYLPCFEGRCHKALLTMAYKLGRCFSIESIVATVPIACLTVKCLEAGRATLLNPVHRQLLLFRTTPQPITSPLAPPFAIRARSSRRLRSVQEVMRPYVHWPVPTFSPRQSMSESHSPDTTDHGQMIVQWATLGLMNKRSQTKRVDQRDGMLWW